MEEDEVSNDIRTRTRFNLCQMLKGSGISLGMAIRGLTVNEDENDDNFGGVADTRRGKSHAVWKAH